MVETLSPVQLDWDGFVRNLRREGTPDRVFQFEHGVDPAMQAALQDAFGIFDHLDSNSATYEWDKAIAVNEYLGLEVLRFFPRGTRIMFDLGMPEPTHGRGPVSSWEEFDAFDWPEARNADLRALEYYEKTLPANMRATNVMSLWEEVRELVGYETFCYMLYEDRALIEAITQKVGELIVGVAEAVCDFDCFGAIYISDDLGYKTSTMLAPDTIRELFIPWHKKVADIAHAHDKLMFLHSCGQMYALMDDYIDHVGIDAKHSFEEQIMPVTEVSKVYGDRVALLGGVDVDLLARMDEQTIRGKVCEILETCVPGGGYFLGAGNWVTSYIPLPSYMAMVDEGRRFLG